MDGIDLRVSKLCTYQCKPCGEGGGSAGNGWGFDQEVKIFANFPRVGKDRFIKCTGS